MKTEANLCSCQSLDIIALPWHNGSPGPVIFPLRLYLRYLEGFPSAPDFSRETSQTGMTMDFQWLIIMPLFLHNFLGIICIKTHMSISAPYAALRRPFLINSTTEITKCHDISWNVSEPPPSDSYLNLLIRWIKSKVCGSTSRHVCDYCDWGSQSVLGGTLDLWHEELRPFFQGYSTLRLVCFF